MTERASGPLEAVEEWLRLQSGSARSARPARWARRGEATPAEEDGWLQVDLRDRPGIADTLEPPLCLAGQDGPDRSTAYPVEQYHVADGLLRLRRPSGAPAAARWVWTPGMSPGVLLQKLRDGLQSMGAAPLARALAAKNLAGPPTAQVGAPPGLLPAQVEAYRACLSPGVRLVWGPPGTGKTQVLARAIEDLAKSGQRVLLVSTANVAVDNALLAVVRALQPERGQVIRVGPPHLAEIATDTDRRLDTLAATASKEVEERRDEVGARLAELSAVDDEIAELDSRLEEYDPEAYRLGAARVAAAARLIDLTGDRRRAGDAADRAQQSASVAQQEADRLAASWRSMTPVRNALGRHRLAGRPGRPATGQEHRRGAAGVHADSAPAARRAVGVDRAEPERCRFDDRRPDRTARPGSPAGSRHGRGQLDGMEILYDCARTDRSGDAGGSRCRRTLAGRP